MKLYKKDEISKEFLEEELFTKNKSIAQISKEIKISRKTITKRMKEFDISKPQKLDLIGKKFGRGIVLKEIPSNRRGRGYELQCDCGKIYKAASCDIRSGNTKSCGCLNRENIDKRYTGFKEVAGSYFGQIKARAKNSEMEFNITAEYIYNLFEKQNKKCRFSGVELIISNRDKFLVGNASLDRIDSTKGYIEGNVQWIHKDLNHMKMALSDKEFIDWCNKISEYNKCHII